MARRGSVPSFVAGVGAQDMIRRFQEIVAQGFKALREVADQGGIAAGVGEGDKAPSCMEGPSLILWSRLGVYFASASRTALIFSGGDRDRRNAGALLLQQ